MRQGHADGDSEELPSGLKAFHTAWDALGDLAAQPDNHDLQLTGKWAGLLPSIPEGQNYLWHTPRGGGLPLFGWRTPC
jgi:DNA (cytosine-5)-methyltransferase 1